MPVGTAIPYVTHIAEGLAAAHQKGVVHRDLKPENILVAPDGGVKIIGFGLAAVTQGESTVARGLSLGTLSYMSPEQVSGAADMFTFGAIVHEMLTGARAFTGDTPIDTMTAVMESDVSDALPLSTANIPPALMRIVDLCLKKHPGSRLSAEDVVIGLRGLGPQLAPADVAAVPGPPENLRRFVRVAAMLGAVALALAVGVWLLRGMGTDEISTSTPASTPPAATPLAAPPPTAPPPAETPPVAALPVETPPAAVSAATPPVETPPAAASATASATTPPVGTPAAVPVPGAAGTQLVWFDREGAELGRVGPPADYGDVSLSPDGMRVAVSVREPGSEAADIWVFDVDSGMGTRVTSDPADDIAPVWSADGRRILFASSRSGSHDIYQRASNETGTDTVVVEAEGDQIAYGWSSDGRFVLYQTDQPENLGGGNLDLWGRQLPGGRPFAFLRTVHAASRATFSPDGSRVVYTSLEGGRGDVYVAQFPNYDGRRRISVRGGSWSRWSRDGSEIFSISIRTTG